MKDRVVAWLRDTAWPSVSGAYQKHELVRQAFTFVVAVFIGWAMSTGCHS